MKTPSDSQVRYQSSRVPSIDSARGAAMLFVCLAHFADSYLFVTGADAVGVYLVVIGMVASPTFVTVSGLVAGFLAITRRSSFDNLRRKLFDRGVFLLLVAHGLIALSGLFTNTGFASAYRAGYITDVIGFAILIGPWLVVTLRARSRLLLAAGIFALDWCAVLFWAPSEGIPALAKHYLIGVVNAADWATTSGYFPVIPWCAVYLVGTVIGERVGVHYFGRRQKEGHLFLAKIGIATLVFGVGVKVGMVLLRDFVPLFVQTHPDLMHFLSFYQKFPPGPVYVTFFGGAGMLLLAGVLEAGRRGIQPFLLNQLRQIGLASLFVYVLQFYLYSVVLRSLKLPYTPFWPFLFLFSILILAKAAMIWNAKAGNRYLTVGIGPLLEWNARRRPEIHEKQIRVEVSAT